MQQWPAPCCIGKSTRHAVIAPRHVTHMPAAVLARKPGEKAALDFQDRGLSSNAPPNVG